MDNSLGGSVLIFVEGHLEKESLFRNWSSQEGTLAKLNC